MKSDKVERDRVERIERVKEGREGESKCYESGLIRKHFIHRRS